MTCIQLSYPPLKISIELISVIHTINCTVYEIFHLYWQEQHSPMKNFQETLQKPSADITRGRQNCL
jgi:hypothetical protein